MLAALVEFLEAQRLEGAFDREYIRVPKEEKTEGTVLLESGPH